MIDGTSVMVQPSISRTYTFIIYYPRRYGYFASGTSSLSPSLPITPRCCFLLVATPDASAKPKGRPVTKQPFHPSVHGFVRADLRSSRSILEYFVKISARKFESEFSFFFIAEDKEERADRSSLSTLSPLLRHETNALSAQSSSRSPPVRIVIRMTITIEHDDSSQLSILAPRGWTKLSTRKFTRCVNGSDVFERDIIIDRFRPKN